MRIKYHLASVFMVAYLLCECGSLELEMFDLFRTLKFEKMLTRVCLERVMGCGK